MFERFTTEAQQVIAHAGQEALELRHQHLGTEHILLGLLWTDVCISRQVLTTAGIDGPGGYVRMFNGSSPHQASSSTPRTQPAVTCGGSGWSPVRLVPTRFPV